MTKANWILGMPILENIFYGEKDIVFVERPNKSVEKHYFKMGENGTIEISDIKTEKAITNPQVKGDGISIDSTSGKRMYRWRIGESYITPLFSNESGQKLIITDQDIYQNFDLGRDFEKRFADEPKKESGWDLKLILQVLTFLGVLVTIYLSGAVAHHFGLVSFDFGNLLYASK